MFLYVLLHVEELSHAELAHTLEVTAAHLIWNWRRNKVMSSLCEHNYSGRIQNRNSVLKHRVLTLKEIDKGSEKR